MSRVMFLVLDSLGIGAAPDADKFGDTGANTLGHIAHWCAESRRRGSLRLPNLERLGLGMAAALISGRPPPGLFGCAEPIARWGAAKERSTGKDTVSGHWELCGLPVDFEWGYFLESVNSFPSELIEGIAQASGSPDVLGKCHASGTEIIERLGEQHLANNWPIVYTSADSVIQIAAHETAFGLDRLYSLCDKVRRLVDQYNIGRVIARPFEGGNGQPFTRTNHRRDWATPPTAPTLLDHIVAAGGEVRGVGKISDIFSGRGISKSIKAYGLDGLMEASRLAMSDCPELGMVFTNFVDFDQNFGHRRDVEGYANELERFDLLLGNLLAEWRDGDLLVLSADHGNDPTWPGSDHTREHVPVLLYAKGLPPASIGVRSSFADVGQSIASWLSIPSLASGESLLPAAILH